MASALCLTFFFVSRNTTIQLTCPCKIGSIIAAWTTFGTLQHFPESDWSWRLPCLLQILIPLGILPLCILIPHSPRWLVAQDKLDEAQTLLAQQHANGQLDDPLVIFELQEIQAAIELERSAASTSYLSFLKSKANRKRLFIVATVAFGGQWNGTGIIFYYIVPVLRSLNIVDPNKQTLVQGGITISSWFFAVGGAILVERLGRRPLFISATGLMLLSLVVVTALSATFARSEFGAAI